MPYSKYNARRTVVDGIAFDSIAEANRWCELRLLERAGKISDLRRQVPFTLVERSRHGRAVVYRADFVYIENGREVVEDVKGVRTEVYKLKRRLMAERYGIEIREAKT